MDNLLLLKEFDGICNEFLDLVDSFPQTARKEILFSEWNLMNIIAHMNGWLQHDLDCLAELQKKKEPYWAPDVDKFNKENVELRKGWNWDKLRGEFLRSREKLIKEYSNLVVAQWDKRFWKNRGFTPRKFVEIDISHYRDEHIPELRKVLKGLE